MQARLVKTIPSTVITSIATPADPTAILSLDEQLWLTAVAERHSAALERRRTDMSHARTTTAALSAMTLSTQV